MFPLRLSLKLVVLVALHPRLDRSGSRLPCLSDPSGRESGVQPTLLLQAQRWVN